MLRHPASTWLSTRACIIVPRLIRLTHFSGRRLLWHTANSCDGDSAPAGRLSVASGLKEQPGMLARACMQDARERGRLSKHKQATPLSGLWRVLHACMIFMTTVVSALRAKACLQVRAHMHMHLIMMLHICKCSPVCRPGTSAQMTSTALSFLPMFCFQHLVACCRE